MVIVPPAPAVPPLPPAPPSVFTFTPSNVILVPSVLIVTAPPVPPVVLAPFPALPKAVISPETKTVPVLVRAVRVTSPAFLPLPEVVAVPPEVVIVPPISTLPVVLPDPGSRIVA